MSSPPLITVLGIAGSLRRGSFNRSLLRAAQAAAPDSMRVDVLGLSDVPLYNGDVEAEGDPEGVTAFKDAIRRSDALLMATPEYNHGVAGVMKNAVDWASRPPGKSALGGKPTAIMGASPGATGTARGQSQLRQSLAAANACVMPQPELLVFRAHEKFDDTGALTDDGTRERIESFLVAFDTWIRRFVHAR